MILLISWLEFRTSLLSISVSCISKTMVGQMLGLHWFTDGLGDLVVDILTGDLGHGVAGLNINRNSLHLGVVNAVLGGNLATSMLDSGLNSVGNSVGYWGNMVSISSIELGISFSISLTLCKGMVTNNWSTVADLRDNILADLLVLDLLGLDCRCCAHIFCSWSTFLCHKNIHLGLAVWCYCMIGSSCKKLGVSLCVRSRGSAGKGEKARNGKNLHFFRNYLSLPTMVSRAEVPCTLR